jgi:hypothetical protein
MLCQRGGIFSPGSSVFSCPLSVHKFFVSISPLSGAGTIGRSTKKFGLTSYQELKENQPVIWIWACIWCLCTVRESSSKSETLFDFTRFQLRCGCLVRRGNVHVEWSCLVWNRVCTVWKCRNGTSKSELYYSLCVFPSLLVLYFTFVFCSRDAVAASARCPVSVVWNRDVCVIPSRLDVAVMETYIPEVPFSNLCRSPGNLRLCFCRFPQALQAVRDSTVTKTQPLPSEFLPVCYLN